MSHMTWLAHECSYYTPSGMNWQSLVPTDCGSISDTAHQAGSDSPYTHHRAENTDARTHKHTDTHKGHTHAIRRHRKSTTETRVNNTHTQPAN